jgi:hypothetical protein
MAMICSWCSAAVLGKPSRCPDCDFACDQSAPQTSGATAKRAAARSVRGGVAPFLFFMISSIFAVCMSLMLQQMPLPCFGGTAPQQDAAPRYNDPQMQGVWLRGLGSVRTALNAPAYRGLTSAYVQRSGGHLTTLCGTVDGSAGTGASAGMHFLSISGKAAGTMIEGSSYAFPILWARLCSPQQASW